MSEPYHILFVDDDVLILAIAEKALSGERHCASCAPSALEALRMMSTMRFDLVIVDIMMPEMDGFSFLKEMHANPEFADIPSIAISVRHDSETEARALRCGARRFLPKPLDWRTLPVVLHDVMRSRRICNSGAGQTAIQVAAI